MYWGGLMPLRRASGPWLRTIIFTYTTILLTSLVVFIQRKFVQGPSPLIVTYIMIIHGDALHMSWNQYCRIGTSYLSVCQGLGELNIWEPLLYMPAQLAWSVTYKLTTSPLNSIWCLMIILILCMRERVNNLQFGQNWSTLNPSRVHMMMRPMYLTFLIIDWNKQLWKT